MKTISLALLLLTSLVATPAHAYPAGVAISTGTNPVRSAAGRLELGTTGTATDVIAAPADQDLVLTDISLGLTFRSSANYYSGYAELEGSDGVLYGVYTLAGGRLYDGAPSGSTQFSGVSGIRIPAGVSITLNWVFAYASTGEANYHFTYTLAGYLAQP
jgi:hypothetical protein